MNDVKTRLKFLRERLKMVQECDWLEVAIGSNFRLVTGRQAEGGGHYVGVSQLPGEVLSRWACNDLEQLSPIIRKVVVDYLEAKIKQLESQERQGRA